MDLICPLRSGSNGNSTLIKGGSSSILVDAGLSCKAICTALEQIGSSYEEIDGILLTHEHSDHIKALPVLLKKLTCPIYATEGVLEYIVKNLKIPAHIPLVPLEKKAFELHDLEIKAFETPHDSVGSVGYQIKTPNNKIISIATDLGCMTEEVFEHISKSSAVLLESNYDEGMLMCSAYPYIIKRRIISNIGHLSNIDCAKTAVKLAEKGVENIILGHLSQNNNMPELAFNTTKAYLNRAGFGEVNLQVAERSKCSKAVIL